jgi:hypothetical protein
MKKYSIEELYKLAQEVEPIKKENQLLKIQNNELLKQNEYLLKKIPSPEYSFAADFINNPKKYLNHPIDELISNKYISNRYFIGTKIHIFKGLKLTLSKIFKMTDPEILMYRGIRESGLKMIRHLQNRIND